MVWYKVQAKSVLMADKWTRIIYRLVCMLKGLMEQEFGLGREIDKRDKS